jgi:hypothetical protein
MSSLLIVVLIAASCTEMGVGGAYVDLLESLHSTNVWLCRTWTFFEAKSEHLFLQNQWFARLNWPVFGNGRREPELIILTIISQLTIFVNIIANLQRKAGIA